MTDIDISGFRVKQEHSSPLHRSFSGVPKELLFGDYSTFEQRGQKRGIVVYPAKLVAVRWTWIWRNGAWVREFSGIRVLILNPKTMEPYASGWRAEVFHTWWDNLDERVQKAIDSMTMHTHPHTKIIITEEPE